MSGARNGMGSSKRYVGGYTRGYTHDRDAE